MDLRVKSTGKEFRRIDNGIALLIEEMFPEAIERINPAPQRPAMANAASAAIANHAVPVWGIWTSPITGNVSIKCSYQRGEYFYDGPSENASTFKVGAFTPSQEVVTEYAIKKRAYLDGRSPTEAWREEGERELQQKGPWKQEVEK